MKQVIKIGLDIDDTLVDFYGEYLKKFGKPKFDWNITKNVYRLKRNKQFWENLPKCGLDIPKGIRNLITGVKGVNNEIKEE